MDTYYKIPLQIENLFAEEPSHFETCTEKESIDQNLELIFTTYPSEHKFDRAFGCKIWLLDFDRMVSLKKWEETFYENQNCIGFGFTEKTGTVIADRSDL